MRYQFGAFIYLKVIIFKFGTILVKLLHVDINVLC